MGAVQGSSDVNWLVIIKNKPLKTFSHFYGNHIYTIYYTLVVKNISLTFKASHGLAPSYIMNSLQIYKPQSHLRTFVTYLYLTCNCHLVSYVHHQRIFFIFRFLIWDHTVQDLSLWQPPHSGILYRLTLRTVPECPFLKTNLKLPFLKKLFYKFSPFLF